MVKEIAKNDFISWRVWKKRILKMKVRVFKYFVLGLIVSLIGAGLAVVVFATLWLTGRVQQILP
jgi:hypothetical protein